MSIISSFIVLSSSALLLLCVDIVGRGKEEVADDDDDEAVSRRNVGEGSLCLDVAYRDCRRECVGERKIGDVDIAGVLAECDDDDMIDIINRHREEPSSRFSTPTKKRRFH